MYKFYTGRERRKYPRKEAKIKVEYAIGNDIEEKGLNKLKVAYSANIGSGGLCIRINDDIIFKEGDQLYIIINLPDQTPGKIFTFVQVVYINSSAEKDYKYKVGLRYLGIEDEERKAIMDFCSLQNS